VRRLLVLVIAAGCTHAAVPAKFHDTPLVTASDDRRPIPEPRKRTFRVEMYLADAVVFRPLWEGLDRRERVRARDTNALDEVPDSTWFTNRIGARDMSAEEAVKGPDTKGAPVRRFTITPAAK